MRVKGTPCLHARDGPGSVAAAVRMSLSVPIDAEEDAVGDVALSHDAPLLRYRVASCTMKFPWTMGNWWLLSAGQTVGGEARKVKLTVSGVPLSALSRRSMRTPVPGSGLGRTPPGGTGAFFVTSPPTIAWFPLTSRQVTLPEKSSGRRKKVCRTKKLALTSVPSGFALAFTCTNVPNRSSLPVPAARSCCGPSLGCGSRRRRPAWRPGAPTTWSWPTGCASCLLPPKRASAPSAARRCLPALPTPTYSDSRSP